MPLTPPGTGSELLAINLFNSLVGEANAALPEIDLFDDEHTIPWDETSDVLKPVTKLDIAELVTYFNELMKGFKGPLQEEFDKNRITGSEYARTYIALTTTAMQSAVQYALGKDQAFWMAAKTQADAITAQNQNELMRLNAMLARAQFALTKLKLASEDSAFGVSEYNRTVMLPEQVTLTQKQTQLVSEQASAQKAQTSETRLDGAAVAGLIGKQKDLYTQQKQSYIDDTKIKAGKVFSDLWITELTLDNGTPTVPDNAQAPTIDTALASLVTLAGGTPAT